MSLLIWAGRVDVLGDIREVQIPADTADASGVSSVATGMRLINAGYGGPTSKGARTLFLQSLQILNRPADTAQQVNYTTSDIRFEARTDINGTGIRPAGAGWAMNLRERSLP